MMNYPLVIDFHGVYIGRGFIAEVTATGRLLAAQDAHDWWLYGVNPGAVAEVGATLEDAHLALRAALGEIIIDISKTSESFETFRARVREFFLTVNAPTASEWDQALTRIRSTQERLESLPVKRAVAPAVDVVEKQLAQLQPDNNVSRLTPSLAKAA